ncbi:insulinase family protein, partial [bacterium]|nr:insulinase family protein [bacterium]
MNNEIFPKLFVVLILAFGIISYGFFSPCVADPKGGGIETNLIVGGPEIVLDPYPSSNVVCIAVSVGAGSIFETPCSRGISHFIEHMVFDGSERFTRDEMNDWVKDAGGFLNAFTRKERTIFFMLVRRDLAEEGLEILSQMLLHSVFPSEELAKERNVVLEEIRQTMDSPGQERGRFIDHYLYRGSRLTETILGYPVTLNEMTREQLLSYYKKFYKPSNMKIFVMGGFDSESIIKWINDYFPSPASGVIKTYGDKRKRKESSMLALSSGFGSSPCVPRWSNEITVRNNDRVSAGLDILVRVPGGIKSENLARSTIMADILSGDNTPLTEEFNTMLIHPPQVSLEVHNEFVALRFHFPSPTENEGEYSGVQSMLKGLSRWAPSRDQVESARTSYLSSDAFDREKFHYYIMLNGEMMSILGESYLNEFMDGIKKVTREDVENLLKKTFKEMEYNACLVRRGHRRFADLFEGEKRTVKTLSNGCIVSARQRKDSDIAALNILIKGRNCLETILAPGSSIVLHKMLEISAAGDELAKKLESLGARIEWGDNPYIPMDDYRLNPSFSFIRLEVPVVNFEEAARILIDYILDSEFTQSDFQSVQKGLTMELALRSGFPLFKLKKVFYNKLFGKHPFGNSLFPGGQCWEKLSPEILQSYKKDYFVGNKIVATLVSGDLPAKSLEVLSNLFSLFPTGDTDIETGEFGGSGEDLSSTRICPNFPDTCMKGRYEFPSPASGAYLMAGFAAPVYDSAEMATILVATEIFNSRMQSEIRERLGLAYSTGCGAKPVMGGVITAAYVGTRAKNLKKAQDALKAQI